MSLTVQQWHQAGGTTNPMSEDNNDENTLNNDENEWTTFDVSNDHDRDVRNSAKGMLERVRATHLLQITPLITRRFKLR